MTNKLGLLALGMCATMLAPARAEACGGFFCSSSPVDQSAERIVFSVDEVNQRTEMIVQISYQGEDDAFAWLLPVGAVPEDRMVFPAAALLPLDVQTGPTFTPPSNCQVPVASAAGTSDDSAQESGSGVTVYVQETVGPYDVVVLSSADPEATFSWLTENNYRLAPAMKPYLQLYTAQGMKFLALKLTADASVQDIQPFRMTLPGVTPSVPLRLTAVAAEPEMGIEVFILGARRYEPANAPELTIPDSELRWSGGFFPVQTNWTALVARKVDEQGGKGWAVEQAGPSAPTAELLQNVFGSTPDQVEARDALLSLFKDRPYLTRLYTRVSPEEMSYDPVFRQSDKGNVARNHTLPFDANQCNTTAVSTSPCEFTSCGQLGLCAKLADDTLGSVGCACAPGSTARAIAGPRGTQTVCQDERMSFMNPGDRDATGNVLADTCVGYDCGEHGKCVTMNLTPTCECEQGYVAYVGVNTRGQQEIGCEKPASAIDKAFYNRRPPALAAGMVAGRMVTLAAPTADPDIMMPASYGDPAPVASATKSSSGCQLAGGGGYGVLLALALLLRRRLVRG